MLVDESARAMLQLVEQHILDSGKAPALPSTNRALPKALSQHKERYINVQVCHLPLAAMCVELLILTLMYLILCRVTGLHAEMRSFPPRAALRWITSFSLPLSMHMSVQLLGHCRSAAIPSCSRVQQVPAKRRS
jgi:hypothetical protein